MRAFGLLALLAIVLTTGWVAADSAPTELVFGPKGYTRSHGSPVTVTDSFTIPTGVSSAFKLRIENGAPAAPGAKQVSSAKIEINGVEVIGGSDFHGNTAFIEKTVKLRGGANTIAVRLTGAPGSAFRLRILGTSTPTVPTSLEPNPLTLSAGATDNLTATLSPPPRSPGILIASSSNSRVASVPRRVAFSAGQNRV